MRKVKGIICNEGEKEIDSSGSLTAWSEPASEMKDVLIY